MTTEEAIQTEVLKEGDIQLDEDLFHDPKPHPGGRPSLYTQELADKICQELALGKSMRTVCKEEEMPSMASVFGWLRIKPEFLEQYARAKEESTDALAEELLDLSDQSSEVVTGLDKSDNARVQAMKLRVDTRKWLMSKMKPKKYGEKIDVTSDGKALPTPMYGGNAK